MSLVFATPGGSPQFLSGASLFDGALLPPIAVNQNDFAPDGYTQSSLFRVRPTANVSITGLQGGIPNRMVWVKNDSPNSSTLTLADNSASSSAVNRFNNFGSDLVLSSGQSGGYIYNPVSNLWDLFTFGSVGGVPSSRAINTTAPLAGGGPLSSDLTLTTSMATSRLIGRTTAGAGVMEEIAVGSGLTLAAGTLSATGSINLLATHKSADTSRTNNTLADDPHLTFSNVAAGTYQCFCSMRYVSASATPGFKAGLRISNAPTQSVYTMLGTNSGGAIASSAYEFATAPSPPINFSTVAGTNQLCVTYIGFVVVATTSDIALQWAQATTNATATQLLQGSSLILLGV